MKLLLLIYDSGMDESVMKVLKECQVTGFTKLFDAHGAGGAGHKELTPTWPGINNILLVGLPPEKAQTLAGRLKELKKTYKLNPGLTLFALDAQEL